MIRNNVGGPRKTKAAQVPHGTIFVQEAEPRMQFGSPELRNELSEMIQAICYGKPDPQFWEGLDEAYLKFRFEEASETEFRSILPVWDLRPESLRFNEVVPDALVGAKLYLASKASFLSHCADAEIYCHTAYKKYAGGNKILKVAGQWLRGDALTPPLFFLDSNRMLRKVDGHHRTTVALLAETPIFPFYCQQTIDIQGVEHASSSHLAQSRWAVKGSFRQQFLPDVDATRTPSR